MRTFFTIVFVIFAIAEIYLMLQLNKKNNKVGFQLTVTNFVLFCFYLIFAFFMRLSIPYYILLLCIIALVLNSFFGFYLNYFEKSTRFDRYLHGYGSFSFALLGYFTIISLIQSGGSKLFRALFLVFLGITLGAVYEVIECIQDAKRGTQLQKGLRDTNFDLIFNILGSVLAALFFFIYYS